MAQLLTVQLFIVHLPTVHPLKKAIPHPPPAEDAERNLEAEEGSTCSTSYQIYEKSKACPIVDSNLESEKDANAEAEVVPASNAVTELVHRLSTTAPAILDITLLAPSIGAFIDYQQSPGGPCMEERLQYQIRAAIGTNLLMLDYVFVPLNASLPSPSQARRQR
ncbi:hypothetical protein BU26DRAFT_600048 [Trematosphaeria pertusa]|uniref:Uncharacterized protein n=1 Tax=Trematosphaeria pertusa TaxID=390896 RepID=A0A6A6IYP0_9PLEO|nr:uncharacterized protein BU26DRAFT_600048 [Trematosphaeria pertusa]KAF2254303.1 hypothetical protein BU26DRAFT_600048 [Trematosphaeria pertusa]